MSKARAAGVLGALILCGLLFLSSFAVAAKNSYFAALQGAFTRGCMLVTQDAQVGEDVFLEGCLLVVRALRALPTFNNTPDDIAQALLTEVQTFQRDEVVRARTEPGRPDECLQCVQTVQEFEAFLAANNTVADIEEAVSIGCARRFSDPVKLDQCLTIATNDVFAIAVDRFLAEFPPLTACRALNVCPPAQ